MTLLSILIACENPISNAVFTADEDFLAALPGPNRLGFPSHFRTAPTHGDEALLPIAAAAALEVEPLIISMVSIGEIIRSTEPAERSPTHRSFAPRPLQSPEDAEQPTWWIRVDLSRTTETSEILWTIEGSRTVDGPWSSFASGWHAPDGVGSFLWDEREIHRILGIGEIAEPATFTYTDRNAENVREIEVSFPVGLDFPRTYAFIGEDRFQFSGVHTLVGSSTHLIADVFLEEDGSGWARGLFFEEEVEAEFTTCWDSTGTRTFSVGTRDFPQLGSLSDCLSTPPP